MRLNDFWSEFEAVARSNPTEETVAFLLDNGEGSMDSFVTPNIARNKEHDFLVSVEEQLSFMQTGRVKALVHSHSLGTDADNAFTESDIASSDAADLPFYVYSVKSGKWNFRRPRNEIPSLVGRPFILGYSDCVTLVSDILRQRDIHLPFFKRTDYTLANGFLLAFQALRDAGLKPVSGTTDVRIGDVLLFRVGSVNYPNHAAVLTSESAITHQLVGRLSSEEVFSASWRRAVHSIWRP